MPGSLYVKVAGNYLPVAGGAAPPAPVSYNVAAATVANLAALSGTQTVDGVALSVGDRVLVKNQTTPSQNGVYTVASGSWARSTGLDTASGIAAAEIAVLAGTANGGSRWRTSFKSTDAINTTAMTWAEAYSDINPPVTLRQTKTDAASVATPPSGTSELFTTDNNALWLKDSTGYVSKIGAIAVQCASTVNIATMSGTGQNIDGMVVAAGDRVLLTAQTTTANNGVWDVAAGAWTRTPGYDTSRGVAATDLVTVRAGTANGGSVWTTTFKETDTINTTAQNWYRMLDTSQWSSAPVSTAQQTAINTAQTNAQNNALASVAIAGRRGTINVSVTTANTSTNAPANFNTAMGSVGTVVVSLYVTSAIGRGVTASGLSTTGFTMSAYSNGAATIACTFLCDTNFRLYNV